MARRLVTLAVVAFVVCSLSNAQNTVVSGVVVDKETHETLGLATVQLLTNDSTFVTGALTDTTGVFRLEVDKAGKYIVKTSNIGYSPHIADITVRPRRGYHIGVIELNPSAFILNEATVTATAPRLTIRDDTLVYSAAAYIVPEGSALEALIESLPGARIEDDGSIIMNGKKVTKFLMEGRELMGGDISDVLKAIPADIVESVKSYDDKSDLAKLTGIDDGKEVTTLDFMVKKSAKTGININAHAGYATEDRYRTGFMASKFTGDLKGKLYSNFNNTDGRSNIKTSKMLAADINYDKKDILKVDGTVKWSHSDNDNKTLRSTESFVSTTGAYSESSTQNFSRRNELNASMLIKWTPDTATNISIRPRVRHTINDSRSNSSSASYSDDPWLYTDNPLSEESIAVLDSEGLMVNSRSSRSMSYSRNLTAELSAVFQRRLSESGRNIAVNTSVSYDRSRNKNMSATATHLFLVQNILGEDSTYQTNRFSLTAAHSVDASAGITYTEPLLNGVYLQLDYAFRYLREVNDRSTYNLGTLSYDSLDDYMNTYRDWSGFLNLIDDPIETYLDSDLSRYGKQKHYDHSISAQLRLTDPSYNINIGVEVKPQRTDFVQDYYGQHYDSTRTYINVSPTLNALYRFSKTNNIRLTYRGSTKQPTINQLLDITDDSNPMHIIKGNPSLKPSFSHNVRMEYKAAVPRRWQSLSTNIEYSATRNAISNMVTYDDNTGVRTTQPKNMNGNWSTSVNTVYNTALDTAGVWTMGLETQLQYNHNVAFVSLNSTSTSERNTVRAMRYNQRIEFNCRYTWLKVKLRGDVTYRRNRNELRSGSDSDTWNYSYGTEITVNMPCNLSFHTSLYEHSWRGYSSINRDELSWNIRLSQGLLRGKKLKLILQWNDVLRQRDNVSFTINANQRVESESESINSFCMLRVIYDIKLFGGDNRERKN